MLSTLRMSEVMTWRPQTITADTRLLEAAQLMEAVGFRHLPVTQDGKLVGILSDRDLKAARKLPDSDFLKAEDILGDYVFAALPDTPLTDAVHAMYIEKIGCVPVVNENEEPLGIFTTNDLLRLVLETLEDEPKEDYGSVRREVDIETASNAVLH